MKLRKKLRKNRYRKNRSIILPVRDPHGRFFGNMWRNFSTENQYANLCYLKNNVLRPVYFKVEVMIFGDYLFIRQYTAQTKENIRIKVWYMKAFKYHDQNSEGMLSFH